MVILPLKNLPPKLRAIRLNMHPKIYVMVAG
jgi:hypothetical protein